MKIYDEQESPLSSDILTTAESSERPEISVFLPVFNEEPNLRPLQSKLNEALKKLGRSAEIVYVDDGSSDDSLKILSEIAKEDPRVRVVALRRNYGQTAAMAAGIDAARGKVLIPMDADLQNDPADIARCGQAREARRGLRLAEDRKDKRSHGDSFMRRIASSTDRWSTITDYGFLMAIVASRSGVRLYGETHHFIPLCYGPARASRKSRSASCAHDGKKKYGLSRSLKRIRFETISAWTRTRKPNFTC